MSSAAERNLRGLRILVVEDSMLVADLIAEALGDAGCQVLGPAPRIDRALALVRSEALDGALLDVNLAGEHCLPIAELLTQRRIPFLFMTGYGDMALPASCSDVPHLTKPFNIHDLLHMVTRCFGREERGGS